VQRVRAFAALIFRHPEVAERLDTVERFRNAKESLPLAQTAQAVCYPRSTLYDWDALYKGDPASLVNASRRRKTAPIRTVRAPKLRATILKMRKRFAWGHREDLRHPAGSRLEGLGDLRRPRRAGAPGERQDQADKLREGA